jgi:hypothetical protein
MVLKTNPKGGPFTGLTVKRVILGGCSEQGVIIRQYMRDGHPTYRTAKGTAIYDGYFPACVADWPEPSILVNGQPLKNFTPGPIEVPVINLAGQQEVESWPEFGRQFRRADSDAPSDKYRIYEIAGMGHGVSRSRATCGAGQQASRFPGHHASANALDKLIKWVDQGIAPPRAERLTTANPRGPLVKDAHGNALGGVRSVAVDVPLAAFFTCVSLGTYEVPFSSEKVSPLYPTRADYLAAVNRRIEALTLDGWLLPADAEEVRSEAVETSRSWAR